MAKYVYEIVNPELFSIRSTESVTNALLGLLAMGISATPVLSKQGRPVGMISLRDLLGDRSSESVGARMTQPVHVVSQNSTVEDAGKSMAELGIHHLVAVDENGNATGIVSSLDLLRAALGIPVRYPAAFPHLDSDGLTWSDPTVVDLDHADVAPDGPGLLILISGAAGQSELPIWAESPNNVRTRIHELLAIPQTDTPYLAKLLEQERSHLRFVAAAVADAGERAKGLEHANQQVDVATGLPQPPTSN